MKNFTFDGRLTKDAEIATTKGGKQYVRFRVANNSYSGGTENTDFIDVTSYDPFVAEKRAQYLTKGTYVIISGDVRFDATPKGDSFWKNIYVTANSIDTPSFKSKDSESGATATIAAQTASVAPEKEEPALTTGSFTPKYQASTESFDTAADDGDGLPF